MQDLFWWLTFSLSIFFLGSGGGLCAQVLSRALPIVPLGKSAFLRRSSLFLHVSAHSLASGQGSCVTGCIAGDLGGVNSRVYLHLVLAFPSEFTEGVRVASYLVSGRLSQQPIFRLRRSC